MDKYHIGTRLKGDAKDYIKSLSLQTSRNYTNIEDRKRVVPHMTFIRPFTINDEKEVINIFNKTLSKFTEPIIYNIIGLNTFEKPNRVLYADVEQNQEINEIIYSLENNLEGKINYLHEKASSSEDKNNINLHFTVSSNIPDRDFEKIKSYLQSRNFKPLLHPLYRVYLLKNDRLLREYDFSLRRNLTSWDALDPLIFKEKTIPKFRKLSGYSKLEY